MKRALDSIRPLLIAVGAAVLCGVVLVVASGSNPIDAYAAILGGSLGPAGWSATVALAVSVVGCALAVAVPLRAGVVNLGGEGQIVMGGLAAVLVAFGLPSLPAPVAPVAAMLAAMLAGAVVALVPAVMEILWKVPLLISSLLLGFPLVALVSFVVRFPLLDHGTGLPQTEPLPASYRMPDLGPVPSAVVVLLLVAAIVVVVDRLTPTGFELRLTGLNRAFTAYAGVSTPRMTVIAMAAGGAAAGLVGALVVTQFPYRLIDGALITPGFVWTGLLAAMLARGNPLGAILAGVFFAALQVGGTAMERETFVPRELGSILQALTIILLAGAIAQRARKNRKVS